jgi:hypothetical protein
MRERIGEALKSALKSGDRRRVSTLRLVLAAITDRDIALRGTGKERADDGDVLDVLTKMVKQREESARLYKEGGRADLEAQENEEIAIVREFLPKPMSADETAAIVASAIAETGATSLRDMGKAMAWLKEHHRGAVDMASAGQMLKARLGK